MYAYQEKIKNLMGTDDFIIGQFPVLQIVSRNSYESKIPDDGLPFISKEIYNDFIDGKLKNILSLRVESETFIANLGRIKNNPHKICRCLALHPQRLAIDMAGNIMACHNFNKGDMYGKNSLYLGNIKEMKLKKKPEVYIDDAIDRKKRLSCFNCLVRHLCCGGCSLQVQDSEYEKYSCRLNFYYNLAIFGISLSIITGKAVKEIIKE
jgi:radical SAM protein with 4Fe4S-binding SPASM domain